MDTEPPTGDDLAKMIVTIKENTLRGAVVEPPRSPRFRFGLIVGIVAVLAVGTASSAVALGLVPHPFAAPAPAVAPTPSTVPKTTPTPTVTASPPAPATSEPTPALTVPQTCDTVVAAADATRLFGSTPVTQLRPVPSGATAQPVPTRQDFDAAVIGTPALYCIWKDPLSDISGLTVAMGTKSSSTLASFMTQLAASGYTCTDAHGGRSCQQVTPVKEYPVDTTSTFFALGDTWVLVVQTNFPTTDLLGAVTDNLE